MSIAFRVNKAFAAQLAPDLPNAMDSPVLLEEAKDLGTQCLVTVRPTRPRCRSARFAK